MSSFKNAAKSNQKTHRERSQPASRSHLGVLEKKKDYRQRADDHQRKQRTLVALKRKALDKNPDEFYFKMIRSRMEDGVHQAEDTTPKYTEEQLKLMQTQDLRYINFKRSTQLKKIEKLKGTLHLLDAPDKPKNKHLVFVDSKKEAKKFNPASYLDTHPALLDRTYNRPRMSQLKSSSLGKNVDDDTLAKAATARQKQYEELNKRIEREKQLKIVADKLEMKKHLMDKKSKKLKLQGETRDSAAVYRWVPQRKR